MKALIALSTACINSATVQTVNARDLHAFLEIGKDFSSWIKDRIAQYGFVENQDFILFPGIGENPLGGRPAKEYALTLDMAKELSMVERNEKGKQARQYFIACERQAKADPIAMLNDPDQLRGMLLTYTEKVMALKNEVKELQPKAAFYDRVGNAFNAQTVQEIAKVIGTGSIRLYDWLRKQGLLMKNNLPYQTHLNAGRFRVIEQHYRDKQGQDRTYAQTLITGKGLTWIQEQFKAGEVA